MLGGLYHSSWIENHVICRMVTDTEYDFMGLEKNAPDKIILQMYNIQILQ